MEKEGRRYIIKEGGGRKVKGWMNRSTEGRKAKKRI